MIRRIQLQELLARLDALLAAMDVDPSCKWRRHFASCRAQAQELLDAGFTQSQLNELSGLVNSVYGGSSSFNDYVPASVAPAPSTFAVVGTDQFAVLSSNAYNAALALRVVGNAA
jgi:hypothetical protein